MAMTVAELQTLLNSVSADTPFTLSDQALGIAGVTELFDTYLPGDALAVSAPVVAPNGLGVSGTMALAAGGAALPVTVDFSDDGTNVTGITLSFTMPGLAIDTPFLSLQLPFLAALNASALALQLLALPNDIGTVTPACGLGVDLPSPAGGSTPLVLNALLPADPAADFIVGATTSGITLASLNDLSSLVTNGQFDILPASVLPLASQFELLGVRLLVGRASSTLLTISIDVRVTDAWAPIDLFQLAPVTATFTVISPMVKPQVMASLFTTFTVAGITLAASAVLPEQIFWAELTQPLSLMQAGAQYRPDVVFPVLPLDYLRAQLELGIGFSVTCASAQAWSVLPGILLTGVYCSVSGSFNGTPAVSLQASLAIGANSVLVSASYVDATTGWRFAGQTIGTCPFAIGDLIAFIASAFGVTVPLPVAALELVSLSVGFTTGSSPTFDFTCTGTTVVGGVQVAFSPDIALSYNPVTDVWNKTVTGTLTLEPPEGNSATPVSFQATFAQDATSTLLSLQYAGPALTAADLAAGLGSTLPAVPSGLDLGFSAASFTCDFKNPQLAIALTSSAYGQGVLVNLPPPGGGWYLLLAAGQPFSLSNLPLVGNALAAIEDVTISDLAVVIGSQAASAAVATAVNALIATVGTGYPQMPAAGTTSVVAFTANVQFGDEPLTLDLGLGSPAPAAAAPGATGPAAPQVLATTTADGTLWFTVQRSFGPLSISRIGVLYQAQAQAVWFEIDATLSCGPLTFDLLGLGVGTPLASFQPTFDLQGLGVAYSNPPLRIVGELLNTAGPGASTIEYQGVLLLSTSRFSAEVFGYYGNSQGFPSLFVFAQMAGAIGGPPAFFVTGAALGAGYNSSVTIPAVTQVQSFPFVQALPNAVPSPNPALFGSSPQPLAVLQQLLSAPAWVSPMEGSLWLATGVTFTSFRLVNAQALLIVEAGSELVVALVGTAVAQFPPQGANIYASVELDLVARLAPSQGSFSAAALLASSSYLVDARCTLSGGFGFYVWFGPSPHAGDFVLTVGGYHPAFRAPKHYPSIPRVRFHWSPDASINIQGSAYLALLPSALMAGCELNATYQSGNLKAWFLAHVDAILRWAPFWVEAKSGITVGVSYTARVFGFNKRFSTELGCDLEFWGPPTGGKVRINWSVISVTIRFGADKQPPPPLGGWADVEALLPDTGSAAAPNLLSVNPVSGLLPGGSGAVWLVRPSDFAFSASTPIPVTTANPGGLAPIAGSPFNVVPLQWRNASSVLGVSIVDTTGSDRSGDFDATAVRGGVPQSLWGSPPQDAKGSMQVPDGGSALVDNQLLGITLQVQPPQTGATAGAIDVQASLAYDALGYAGAVLPLSASATAEGDLPTNSPTSMNTVTDPGTGIGTSTTAVARDAVYGALLAYAPPANDAMTRFTQALASGLAAPPLLVSGAAA